MLYYQGYAVSFQEIPDEVTLVIEVADCRHRCPGCHSPELQKPEGSDLEHDLESIISQYSDAITCVCLMGDGQDDGALFRCAEMINNHGFKSAVYTGGDEQRGLLIAPFFDYVKYGPYIKERGGLDSDATNQHLLRVTKHYNDCFGNPSGISFEDITWKFRKSYT